MRHTFLLLVLVALLVLPGCGTPTEFPVAGTVHLNNQPLAGASITYYPEEGTGGLGGSGRTDDRGHFQIRPARGQGLAPGKYRVVISRPLNPDGSLPDPNVPPIESQAKESLPAHYSERDQSKLTATVDASNAPHSFPLEVKTKS